MEYIYAIIFYSLICAYFCSYLARTKNREAVAWFLLGFLFGIFALIAIAGTPSDTTDPKAKSKVFEGTREKHCGICGNYKYYSFQGSRCQLHNMPVKLHQLCDDFKPTEK